MYLLTKSSTLETGVTVSFTSSTDTGNIIDDDLTTSAETSAELRFTSVQDQIDADLFDIKYDIGEIKTDIQQTNKRLNGMDNRLNIIDGHLDNLESDISEIKQLLKETL